MKLLKIILLLVIHTLTCAAADYSSGRYDEIVVQQDAGHLMVDAVGGRRSLSDVGKKEWIKVNTELVEHAINSQTRDICEAMQEYSESKLEFETLIVKYDGNKGEAMTQFCYKCSKTEFKQAITECHRSLIHALNLAETDAIRKAILVEFELHDGIKKVLPLMQSEEVNSGAGIEIRVSVFES